MKRLALIAMTALAVSACGGNGSSKLSDEDLGKLTAATSTITGYCVQQIQSQTGEGTGGSLGQVNQAVSDMIDVYKAHPDADVQLAPNAPKRSIKAFLRDQENQLGNGDCDPDAANRIEQAISG